MKPVRSILSKLSAALFAFGVLAVAPVAGAADYGPYRMDILVNGVPVQEYQARGTTYIEAKRGREYAVRLSNNTGERVAVALAVDGMNSIDAKHTSAAAARKWILGPYESIVVNGWQTSSSTARQFFFTKESGSYGAWMGKTRDLGNISAAFFREQRSEPRYYYVPEDDGELDAPMARRDGARAKEEAARAPMPSARAAAPSASADAAAAPSVGAAAESGRGMAKSRREGLMAEADEPAATGIGRERYNQVYTVEFRQEASPAAVLTVRYEFRNKLIEMGILPRPYRPDPMSRRETSSGFTDYGYAPDPWNGR
jgi:hypothetical protein